MNDATPVRGFEFQIKTTEGTRWTKLMGMGGCIGDGILFRTRTLADLREDDTGFLLRDAKRLSRRDGTVYVYNGDHLHYTKRITEVPSDTCEILACRPITPTNDT
jgi:hypothetical protein